MNHYNLNVVVLLLISTYSIPNIVKITKTIQSVSDKYFAIVDLTGMFYSKLISTAFQPVCFNRQRDTISFELNYPWSKYINSFAIVLRTQDHKYIYFSPGVQAWHYSDNILLGEDSFNIFIKDIQV